MNEAAERFERQPLAKGSFPDLTGDGEVTQADVLKGRGVFAEGSLLTRVEDISKKDVEYINNIENKKDREEMISKYQIFAGYDALSKAGVDELNEPEKAKEIKKKAAEKTLKDLKRYGLAEGSMLMPVEGMPVDTYPNIPDDEMDEAMASQLPDDEMEEDYIKYVMDESLDDEEQMYLAGVLQDDPRLSDILDKVITVASEFSGAGEVDGPGTGVSDSIPARLSDGEFVFTRKATDQIGADNLQVMMDDAERAYDGGYQMKAIGGYMEEDPEQEKKPMSVTDEEIKKLMMGANKMPSLQ